MRRILAGSVVLLFTGAACSATPAPPPAATPAAVLSPSPTPSATPRTRAQDAADARRALVKADDLGKPWVQPKKVNRTGSKAEVCPGHRSALRNLPDSAEASADFTEGAGTGKNIASYRLTILPDESAVSAMKAAYAKDQRACSRYQDAAGFSVVRTVEGPTTVSGANVVASFAERVYYVKPRKLAYARHYVVAHEGRVATTVSYAFLLQKDDPKAKDFGRTTELLEVQLKKNPRL